MIAKDLNDLNVYRQAHLLSDAVSAILQRPALRDDLSQDIWVGQNGAFFFMKF